MIIGKFASRLFHHSHIGVFQFPTGADAIEQNAHFGASAGAFAERIAKLIADTPNPVLVGHSFGASVLLKYLVDAVPQPSFAGLFLIATPFWGPDFPEFALPADFGARLRDVSPLFLYHSRDDHEVPFEHVERYSRALPQATVRAVDGRGHEFNQAGFPELVADIRQLKEGRTA